MNIRFFFTADTHLGHANIIKYCNRPFRSVEEMDEAIIQNWNKVVRRNDIIFHLGDFCFGNYERLLYYLRRLNGLIYLISGDHDQISSEHRDCFAVYYDNYAKFTVNGMSYDPKRTLPLTLCHYSMRTWAKSHYGSYHLYGHSHGRLPEIRDSLSFDVGVDSHDFVPWSAEDVIEKMRKKDFTPINKRKD